MTGIAETRPRKRIKLSSSRRNGSPVNKSQNPQTMLDNLGWKKVVVDGRLDDAEGFFGLEEIENVEVIRGENGQLEYKPFTNYQQVDDKLPDDEDNENGLYEEWEGFADDDFNPEPEKQTKLEKPRKNKKNTKDLNDQQKKRPLDGENKAKQVKSFSDLHDDGLDDTDVSAWFPLNLSPETLLSLSRLKFSTPTLIQSSAIPEILAGHDVIGKAPTGSGKTLAFGIPILEQYVASQRRETSKAQRDKDENEFSKPPLALILSPTRELAHQLTTHLTALFSESSCDGPSIVTLTGGLSNQKQARLLKHAQVLIGTPGRLWEILNDSPARAKWLKDVKFLIVDEADRLLSEGHFKEVEEILDSLDRSEISEVQEEPENSGKCSPQRQTLVFSATFQKDLQQKLAGKYRPTSGDFSKDSASMEYLLKRLAFREETPKFVDVNPINQMAQGLREALVECAGTEKDLYLFALLLLHRKRRTLVFTNSISSVRRLAPFLQNLGLPAHALHSQMAQKARLRAIERFSSGETANSILIATDIAARGLDIRGIEMILHYHVPRAADAYVHRSGRTARASNVGLSILLCSPDEVVGVRRLIAKVHSNDPRSGKSNRLFIQTLDINRTVVARLKPRVTISKKLADSMLAKEKKAHEGDWLRTAAEELGVDYDSDEFEAAEGNSKGRGTGRKRAAQEARSLTKSELSVLRAELRELLGQRINMGVSERYLAGGAVNMQDLLDGKGSTEFLGSMNEVNLE
ncbi:MAG: ATP-dependent RNA helicase [Trizodia sp. TS-e1964]|nr:MAG: ATP-dependent RNA helicase [Trizodia sp. TS-e1964]